MGLAFFALNPNLLYLQTTAMTEPLFLCEMIWLALMFAAGQVLAISAAPAFGLWLSPRFLEAAAALSVARDPQTLQRSRVTDRWEATGVRDGVRIRVVVRDDGFIVTAIPLDGQGVVRNPK